MVGVSNALFREEVLRRRRRRLVQLYSIYRAHYWALADELSVKHGEYWWEHGASPVLSDAPPRSLSPLPHLLPLPTPDGCAGVDAPVNGGCVSSLENGGVGAPAPAPAPAAAGSRPRCAASDCNAKAMPLAPFCFDHITLDTKQQLYKPCAFVTKQRDAPNGVVACGKPALRGSTPLRCVDHSPKSQKIVLEALESIGIDLPLTCKSVPKLNLLISEAVREIQMKRKLSLNVVKKTSGCPERICLD